MKKLFKFMLIVFLLISILIPFTLFKGNTSKLVKSINVQSMNNSETLNTQIDYSETLDTFDNPERGFYTYLYHNFKVSNNEEPKAYLLEGNLIHLRLGIGAFSGKVNKDKDLELSEDMLNMFDNILKKIKANGATAIVRFAYDNFEGDENLEPSLDMILKHIEQICPILTENKDAISYIELGFFGPWGEMHTSDISTPANVTKALNVMLENTPEELKIGVRQPKYYVDFAGVDREKLNENITVKGTKEYRVGLFNDGYLGSHSDLGTFENRETEISWLENQALHTLYGGEVVGTRGSQENDKINTAEYMSKEAFRTHTTYLNYDYDKSVINSWKDEIYNGDDELYKEKSGYLYIANHMGYRFVLRNSNITVENNKINFSFSIENVGFANLVNSKVVSLVLENDSSKFEFATDLDATIWNSKSTSNINVTLTVPDNFEEAKYNVYLRISKYGDYLNDNNYQCIRLANNNIWDETLGANYIGEFIFEKENIPEPDNPNIPDTPDVPEIPKINTEDLGYKIAEQYIQEVKPKTPVQDFKEILLNNLEFSLEITDEKNETKITDGYVKTGMYAKIVDENGNILKNQDNNPLEFQIVVTGDITGDGIADALDFISIKLHRAEVAVLQGINFQAGDLNFDGYVDAIDSKLLLLHRAEVQGYDLNYTK